MPLFYDPDLLFLHIPKNAGRSIEGVFMDTSRALDRGRPNFVNRAGHLVERLSRSKFAYRHLVGTQDITVAAQHLTYAEMELLGLLPAVRPKAVFCVCRDPFDRAVSSVTHFFGPQTTLAQFEYSLDAWLDQVPTDHNKRAHRRTQLDFILDRRGRPIVTDILRFERLNEDFSDFVRKLGQPHLRLPWRGKATRTRELDDVLTRRARSRIEDEFGEDLEFFRYPTLRSTTRP